MRIICLSDTHGHHRQISVPEGELLLHAGDLTAHGSFEDLEDFAAWFRALPQPQKVLIAGNHDFCCERSPGRTREILHGLTYLQDESALVAGLRIYGSPWQPWFYDWAFNLRRGDPLRKVWAKIPDDTQILLTHGPPHRVLDMTDRGEPAGCEDLLTRVAEVRPALHVFGHIHEGYGRHKGMHTWFVNGSACNVMNVPVNAPQRFLWDGTKIIEDGLS